MQFYCCRFAIVEIFKHKNKLVKYSTLTEDELLIIFHDVLRQLTFYDELSISNMSVQAAFNLCRDIDEKDTPFIALTIELDGVLWSGDKELMKGLRAKGFNRFFDDLEK